MKRILLPAILAIACLLPSAAKADLTLTVNTFTANELKFTISGTFDSDAIGDQKDWLAVKSDFQNNVGNNVDWIDDSLGFSNFPGGFTVVTNTITFNGGAPSQSVYAASGQTWGDSIYFNAGFDLVAGTTVAGMVHLQSAGAFDTSTGPLELASGFDNSTSSWARFEGSAIPEPAAGILSAGVLGALFMRRRKR